ncbi:MAG: nucleotide-binding protein [Candidatus Woesearchaeota archaeon]
MKKVILDTDFLIHCAKFKIDYTAELARILNFNFEPVIIDKTLDELDSIIAKGKKEGRIAKLAKTILKHKNILQIETKKDKIVDELILDVVDKEEYIVATMDADLKRRLKKKGVPVVVIRQKKYLQLFNY